MDHPSAGTHYPRSVGEFQAWFRTDATVLDYLEHAGRLDCGRWWLGDGRFRCSGCGGRSSVTAGTIFDRTRTAHGMVQPVATGKDGISALSRSGRSRSAPTTAWAMLHRLRSVLVRRGRDRLADMVEVDETTSAVI